MTQLTATCSSFRQPDPLHVRPSYPLVDGRRPAREYRVAPRIPRFSPIFLISVESNTPRLREFRRKERWKE